MTVLLRLLLLNETRRPSAQHRSTDRALLRRPCPLFFQSLLSFNPFLSLFLFLPSLRPFSHAFPIILSLAIVNSSNLPSFPITILVVVHRSLRPRWGELTVTVDWNKAVDRESSIAVEM